jgi:hypothetical protein
VLAQLATCCAPALEARCTASNSLDADADAMAARSIAGPSPTAVVVDGSAPGRGDEAMCDCSGKSCRMAARPPVA